MSGMQNVETTIGEDRLSCRQPVACETSFATAWRGATIFSLHDSRYKAGPWPLGLLGSDACVFSCRSYCFLLFQAPAPSQPKPIEYKETTLPNGLRVITHEDHSTPVTNVQVWYHVGSKDEKAGRTGSLIYSNTTCKAIRDIKPERARQDVTNAGGGSNAYTQDDVTVYWETFPANYLEKVLWMEADRMTTLNVSEDNFKAERSGKEYD